MEILRISGIPVSVHTNVYSPAFFSGGSVLADESSRIWEFSLLRAIFFVLRSDCMHIHDEFIG